MPSWVERNNGLIKKWWQPSTIADGEIVAVYQPLGASSQADSYVNLVNPGTNDAALGVAPTWAKNTGWVFAGASHLTTGIIPTSAYSIFAHCNIVASTAGGDMIAGLSPTNAKFYLAASLSASGGFFVGTLSWGWGSASDASKSIGAGVLSGRWSQTLASSKAYYNNELVSTIAPPFSGTPIQIFIGARNNAGSPAQRFRGRILALAIYNRQLTANEVSLISSQAHLLTEFDDPTPNVHYIVIHPKTRHLSSFNHELLIATDTGIYRSKNGGRQWGKVELPDPSNAEFGDVPAATVEELTFDWIDYDPTNPDTILCRGLKASVSRMWIYRSDDAGANWSSRGVVVA